MTTVRETAPAAPDERGRTRKVIDVIDDRLGIKALEYPVPEHANNLAWSLGGVTAFVFGLLIVTGFILVQFYNPSPASAN
jgi:quinol-cytochrome oxidoreductase complex cytochrome b subunit